MFNGYLVAILRNRLKSCMGVKHNVWHDISCGRDVVNVECWGLLCFKSHFVLLKIIKEA